MSNPGDADTTPIKSVGQLADYIAAGCKPRESWRVGTEHEKFGFRTADHRPPPYEPDGIRAMLDGIAGRGWEPILDRGQPIGLRRDGVSVSLEPGGQFELSGAPLITLHETQAEFAAHVADVRAVAEPLCLGFAPLGFHPLAKRSDMPWMPKGRYEVMRRYMARTGQLGHDMMLRTCTVQVNLDFGSEADMVRKLRVSLALQAVATAMFANSPFTEGRPNGFLSARAHVWTDTDPDRTGIPPVVFEVGFGFERYVEWLLDVPMYFVHRDGTYHDVAGASFRDFMAGRLSELSDVTPTVGDFADHMTTAFTDVRVKRFLEMRGSDAGSPEMMLAQSAFWVGLLYDQTALDAAYDLIRNEGLESLLAVRRDVPRLALNTPWRAGTLRDLAREAVHIAYNGLKARGCADAHGRDESHTIAPLFDLVAGGPTQAERWLQQFHTSWNGDVTPIFAAAQI